MISILSMNDFELYIHMLARDECMGEDVCTVPEMGEACFSDESEDESLTWLVLQLFEGLDAWNRDGDLSNWYGTCYIRSVLAFIGHPVGHGSLVSVYGNDDGEEDDW